MKLSTVRQAFHKFYRVDERLSRGSVATLFKAHSTEDSRPLVLKVLGPPASEGGELYDLIIREIKIHRSIEHPHVVRFINGGTLVSRSTSGHPPYCFLAIDYIQGRTLWELKKRRALNVEQVAQITISIASALHTMHRQRLVHRDVNPFNIMVRNNGHPLLIDFGIAIGFDDPSVEKWGQFCTPSYTCPAQMHDGRRDGRCDLFSLAMVLYECLTGQRPFDPMEREWAPAPASALNNRVPRALDGVLLKALQRRVEDRFSSVQAFARAIKDACQLTGRSSTKTGHNGRKRRKQKRETSQKARRRNPSAASKDWPTLASYKDFGRQLISRWAPIPPHLIYRHADMLDWELLSANENILWSAHLITAYKERWDWQALSANPALPFDEKLLSYYGLRWDREALSMNPGLPWTGDFIARFANDWRWSVNVDGTSRCVRALSLNEALPWSVELINRFSDRWDFHALSANPALPWTPDLLRTYRDRWVWSRPSVPGHDSAPTRDRKSVFPYSLSTNTGLPWTEQLIEQYEELWDWDQLSANPALPWTRFLIDRYHDRWNWDLMSINEGLPWSCEMYKKLKKYIDNNLISYNRSAGHMILTWDVKKHNNLKRYPFFCYSQNFYNQSSIITEIECKDVTFSVPETLYQLYISRFYKNNVYFSGCNQHNSIDNIIINQLYAHTTLVPINNFYNPSMPWGKAFILKIMRDNKRSEYKEHVRKAIASNTGIPWSRVLLRDLQDVFLPQCKDELVHNPVVWQRAYATNVNKGSLQYILQHVVR